MNARDLLVLAIIFASLPFCFVRPFVGGLVWTWIGFMNPHRLAWGYAKYNFPIAYLVAVVTLLGFLFSSEPKRLPRSMGTYCLFALWVCVSASTIDAFNPVQAYDAWVERTKILLMLGVIVMLTNSRERLRALLLTTAASLGFYGCKGGIFALLTGLQQRLFGPEGSFLQDNNALGLALNMLLPLLFYLREEVEDRRRWLFTLTFALTLLAIISTYSRGALLGLAMVTILLLLKSKRKAIGIGLVGVLGAALLWYSPEQWTDRMSTIQTYESDTSAMGRVNAWRLAWRLGLARPILGWGPEAMEDKSLYLTYYPDSPTRNDVHSAYFQVLAESGFPALGFFVGLLAWSLWRLRWIAKQFRDSADRKWLSTYADMLQVSLLAFAVSGTFLELAYFDLVYHIVGSAIVLNDLAIRVPQPIRARAASLAVGMSRPKVTATA